MYGTIRCGELQPQAAAMLRNVAETSLWRRRLGWCSGQISLMLYARAASA